MKTIALLFGLLATLYCSAQSDPPPGPHELTQNALPFTVKFREISFPTLYQPPAVHSYSVANSKDGLLLIMGGRRSLSKTAPAVGLHGFRMPPTNNFPSPNRWMSVVDPIRGLLAELDVTALPTDLALVLQATNGQGWYDRAKDLYYLVGGYGPTDLTSVNPDFNTFGVLLRFPVTKVIQAILTNPDNPSRAAAVLPLIEWFKDDRLAITGGELHRLPASGIGESTDSDWFFLTFGQNAKGRYSAFSGFQQTYSSAIRAFKISPQNFSSGLLLYAEILKDDTQHHRRDGNIVDSIDPASGKHILSAYGGVFVPGRIAGFTNPVHITASQTATLESNFIQRLGAYECPVIVIHDPASKKTHHVLFGGISHFFYHQTGQHQSVYYWVTRDGRNDGLPYTEDISVITRSADGSSHEWILPFPIPARGYPPPRPWPDPIITYNPADPFISNLRGASTHFIPNAKLIGSRLDSSGVVLFDQIDPGEEIVIGHIYGGIEARYPLPVFTGTGSKAGNAMYEVIFAKVPSPAIDASLATEAIGTLDTQSKLENRANSSAPTTTRPQN